MFAWWGRTVYRYRYIVIGVMVALCLGGGVYGISLGKHVTQSGFYDDGSQSVHASVLADKAYGRDTLRPHRRRSTPRPTARPSTTRRSRRRSWTTSHRSRRTTPTRSCGSIGYFKSPDVLEEHGRRRTRQHAFMSIQLKGDNDDTILNNYKAVEDRPVKADRRRQRQAGRPAAAGQRADRHHRRGPAARRGARPSRWSRWCCSSCSAAWSPPPCPAIIGGLTIAGALGIMRLVAEFAPGALLRPAGGDADRPRHRDRLRPVHGQPVP